MANKKICKIWSANHRIKKSVVAATLEELVNKGKLEEARDVRQLGPVHIRSTSIRPTRVKSDRSIVPTRVNSDRYFAVDLEVLYVPFTRCAVGWS